MEVQGHQTYTCATENPELHIPDWKTNKLQYMSRNIYDHTFFYIQISYAENLSTQNTQSRLLPGVGNEYDRINKSEMCVAIPLTLLHKKCNSKYLELFQL